MQLTDIRSRICSDAALFRDASHIDGQWVSGKGDRRIAVTNPADGTLLARVAALSASQARGAVDAAQAAFAGWSGLLPQERAQVLRRWYALMIAHREDLARLMVLEQGKPLSEARGEIDYAAAFLEFYAEEARRPNIEGVTSHLPDAEVELWREPVGVAALVTPWNFPSAMLTRKAGAALAAGCTVVAHPSAETPLSALALAELAQRAGLPPGVFNVVTGEAPEIVGAWTVDARVRALSFTGSTQVGKLLYRQSADTVKRLVLELGGHAPFLVFADADLDRAVAEAVKAKFATTGQDCLGANRFLIERPLYEAFCARFTAAVEKLTLGPGMEDRDLGPLMNEAAVAKQEEHVADALARGATLLAGGSRDPQGPLFYRPTVLAGVPQEARIMSEETFGPVAALAPFDTEDEAISRANATEYGLIAYLHTADPRRIYRASRALGFGMVAVNRTKVTGAPIPFGGMKQSGLGREGARLGMEAFTEVKYLCRDWS
ncbi:NAD-dependent succinate-semialdehyde dehydrogenase [Pseudooceanicola sp. CBS1P-1]|uniref:Aldehyde dehydrogenase family protein n=1 Tax=Pseudooceanicola albus TaxID=2692189 RepID=A0A6L7G965_9RHOB|nr:MULTISPECIES: NAD-dependent succinate-semialdehyde dehydrogenase [Pseudooceanicola]MBT9384326.1 NAD-dependent succinate-semialdehyde dehydrogenase [Pseudooceanicola endophyticus]MXN19936.1 aldehyde dehydrogenase family protein [Pseudooceanicola albus]